MSGFSAQWLAMREVADARARNHDAVHALNRWLPGASMLNGASINICDLGCGTGSNLRWLAPHINARQCWRLFDNDPDLLAARERRFARVGRRQRRCCRCSRCRAHATAA